MNAFYFSTSSHREERTRCLRNSSISAERVDRLLFPCLRYGFSSKHSTQSAGGSRAGRMGDDPVKFEKIKLPSHGLMPGVAFHCADQQLAGSGPRIILFGGQRRGITGEMWCYETNGDGWMQVHPETSEGATLPPERTQGSIVSLGEEPQTALMLFAGYVLNVGEAPSHLPHGVRARTARRAWRSHCNPCSPR